MSNNESRSDDEEDAQISDFVNKVIEKVSKEIINENDEEDAQISDFVNKVIEKVG